MTEPYDRYIESMRSEGLLDETSDGKRSIYEEWARWLVVDTGAPWNWKPDVLPPPQVLRLMPQFMYDHDNRRRDDLSIIHQDVTREDYAGDLREEWGCSTAFESFDQQEAS